MYTRIQLHLIKLCKLSDDINQCYQRNNYNVIFFYTFSKFLNKSTSVIICLFLPVLNVQLLLILNLSSNLTNAIFIASLSTAVALLVDKCWKIFLDAFIVAQSMFLLYLSISYAADNYWLISMSILVVFNYFIIPQLASRYSVPKLDLFSITFIFQCIFLVNAFF